jgi:6-phosphogluconolactonase
MARDVEVHVAADADEAAQIVARELVNAATQGGHIAVSGGSSPGPAYELAADLVPDWSGVEVWFADERCVPPDDRLSNYRLLQETLLTELFQPPIVRRVHGELPPIEAAASYDEQISGIPLDLALLGVGPDGHTASLFPGSPALEERERAAVAAEPGFEPFVPRVTLTIPALSAAALVIFLVVGEDKANAAAHAFAREPSPATPASLVRSAQGRTLAVLDQASAALLGK